MKKRYFVPRVLFVGLFAALLSACTTSQVATSSDQEYTARPDRVDIQRRATIRLQLAGEYYQQGQLQIALDEVRQVLQIAPNFPDAHSMAALIYMDLGDARQAEEHFSRALRLSPQDPDLNNNYGWFLCQHGRPEQSIAHFEAAFSNRAYRSPAKAMTNAGTCSIMLNKMDAAGRYLNESFRLDPSNSVTAMGLARVHYHQKDYRGAKFFVDRVIGSGAAGADILWLAIRIERQLGDRATEISLVTQLSRRYPDSAEFAAYQRGAFNE